VHGADVVSSLEQPDMPSPFARRVPARRGARPRLARRASPDAEMRHSAFVGLVAALLIGVLLDAGAGELVAGALLGTAAGAVLGLLLWIEAADLPEPPIPAPALSSQERGRAR
jgi:hypothetical protein